MKALWKGAIYFGLVTIPVSLIPATRREELKFRLLRKSDLSPVNYKRVAEADGKEVHWDEIVKGCRCFKTASASHRESRTAQNRFGKPNRAAERRPLRGSKHTSQNRQPT